MSSSEQETAVSPDPKGARRQKRPDMKLYAPPRAPRTSNALLGSSDDQFETDSERKSPNAASIEKLRDISKSAEPVDCDSWDTMFDDDGECINSNLVTEFKKSVNVSTDEPIKVQRPKSSLGHLNSSGTVASSSFNLEHRDVAANKDNQSYDENFGHVLELFGCSNELKTQDIRIALVNFLAQDYEVIWVNDYHALLIFSSKQKAQEALKGSYANIRLRKLSQATAESKSMAVSLAPLPYKKRPETSAVIARRLVSGALGLKVNISPEQRAAESKKLQEARDRKRNMVKQSKDVWEGNVN